MSKYEIRRDKKVNILLVAFLFLVLVSGFFYKRFEVWIYLKPNISKTNSTQIHFVDVGQGDAIAINFSNGKVMLVDSGTKEYEKKFINYLDNVVLKGKKKIDYVLLTHPDIDHSGNMKYIIDNYAIGTFLRPSIYEYYEGKMPYCTNEVYRDMLQSLLKHSVETKFVSDYSWQEGSVKINILTIEKDNYLYSTNEYSPIIVIEENGRKALLSGDITEDIEEKMIDKFANTGILDVDILKLAHHGSKYSNSAKFLNVTSPQYIVASVGENTYGHPANETLQRILDYDKENNTQVYNNFLTTKNNGNIIYSLDTFVNVDTIKNIDDYNFLSYFVFVDIASVFLVYYIIWPYVQIFNKKKRFNKQNNKYALLKNQEKSMQKNK